MRKISLYRVEPLGADHIFIAARTPDHAAEIYVTHELANDREVSEFSIERFDHRLPADQQAGLAAMLANGVTGVAAFDGIFGWCVTEAM